MNPMQMVMQLMASGQKPEQVLQEMMMQNPNAQGMLNQIRNSGMNPKQFVEQLARQQGVDLNQLYQFAQKNGIRL